MTNTNVTKGQVMPTNRSNTLVRPIRKKPVTPQQIKIVKAKIYAEIHNIPQREIAQQLYPNQTQHAAEVTVSRELKNADVQDLLRAALHKHGISVDSVVKVVAQGLKARKVIDTERVWAAADESGHTDLLRIKKITAVDHGTRLNAVRTAKSFLGLDQDNQTPGTGGGNTFIFNTERSSKYVDAEG